MKIKKVLIANRGEIASRVIRTCQKLGIQAVAVYSEADQALPYVRQADEAYLIGPGPVVKSYLNQEKILEVAQEADVDAIHPGYGLLSENAYFAKKVIDAGLVWIGPRPEVIAQMGEKVTARQVMQKAGVPVVPGSDAVKSVEEAAAIAQEIGFPVLLKASSGGGGMGMYLCHGMDELRSQFPLAQQRAKALFGDDTFFVEKWISPARHIEVQVIGDQHGNVIHLFERECSVQRRNQKVIEESLSPSISQETRQRLYEAALLAARSMHYTNAGTIEFVVDSEENFYFLEMNTRLQVEHPVTEAITGVDLVELQFAIAEGKELPWKQEEMKARGHAIEFRLYAENPKNFYPSPGLLQELSFPVLEGVRIDAGYETGNTVTPFYDPMIAKVIVSGSWREEVIEKAKDALSKISVSGIQTNLPVLLQVLDHPSFVAGKYDTNILNSLPRE